LQTNQLSHEVFFQVPQGEDRETKPTNQEACAWTKWTATSYPPAPQDAPQPTPGSAPRAPQENAHCTTPFLTRRGASFCLGAEEKQLLNSKRYNTPKRRGLLLNISSLFQVFPLLAAILLNRAPLAFPVRVFVLIDLPLRHGYFHKISVLTAETGSQPLSPASALRSTETLQIP